MTTYSDGGFLARLRDSRTPLLSDGAMGTMLNARGIGFDQCFDALNLLEPHLVREVHAAYLVAGAEIVQTNTFGANRFKLGSYGWEDRLVEVNRSGVELARSAIDEMGGRALLAGDVGPLGVRLAPYGRVQPEQARQAFLEQITALAAAGVDLLILETFSDLYEIREAVVAARQACNLPVVASMTFTRDDRTLLGDAPAKVVARLVETGADVIGINCSGGPAQLLRILTEMRKAAPQVRFSLMPNAGWPEQVGGRIMYPANPEYFGEVALAFCEAGASLVGGCCGTTPQHIAAMRAALDGKSAGCKPLVAELEAAAEKQEPALAPQPASQLAQKLGAAKFVVAVEMDPPRGLSAHKILAGASLLHEAGADVINVADSPMARMRMSPWAVCDLIQRDVGVETTLHFPTRGRNLLRVQGDLLAAHALGIHNVFVVMGDPTAIGDYPDAMDNYDLVPSGLIKLIKQDFNLGVDHAGVDIGQPTSFFVGCALNLTPQDFHAEAKNLRRKLRAGSDFILTQPVYNPLAARSFLERYAEEYGPLQAPLLVGVLPLASARHAAFLHNEVPGVDIPEEMRRRMQLAGERAPQEGVAIALELVAQVKDWANGIYLMPAFNRYDLAAEIVEGCRQVAPSTGTIPAAR
ncbi:MAG: bifunctional homocysteine S-methyltransferase/methylenetetrahydrofolate reductase [Anaerolineales bacterium]|nr:bifunctional homocysteine S-methyltransferase/methylenetetrahydrofolate reductase [Anaerolineales bacterium]